MKLRTAEITNHYIEIEPVLATEENNQSEHKVLLPQAMSTLRMSEPCSLGKIVDYGWEDADIDELVSSSGDKSVYALYETAGLIEANVAGKKRSYIKKNHVIAYFDEETE